MHSILSTMYLTRKILLCFWLFNIDGTFFSRENLVYAFENPLTPGLAIRNGIKTAIIASSHILGSWRPLTVFAPLEETCLVNLTSQSLDMRMVTTKTVGTVTGGVLGKNNYEVVKVSCFWNTGSFNKTSMECRVYFFNLKYNSFKNALDHEDGIMVMNYPVVTDFKCTFGKIRGISQEAVSDGFIQNAGIAKTPVERHEGICVVNIPA
ncbi:uncharacterized protein LOC135837050 isoform X3 [Planococcus citri]|uniref:uncharacterized protein LOC135837050 isoform X3 n=1 Tax=Planococcus citri TaxID=170843 RepID=UPI0031F7DD5F